MNEEKRYCKECGNHTTKHRCEICGRKTERMDSTDQKEHPIFDHIPQPKKPAIVDQLLQYGQSASKTHQKSKTEKKDTSDNKSDRTQSTIKLLKVLAIVIAFVLFISVQLIANLSHSDNEIQRPSQPPYHEYIEDIQETTDGISCMVDEDKDGPFMKLINPTAYYISGNLYDEEDQLLDASDLEPYSETIIRLQETPASFTFEYERIFTLNYKIPTISYTWYATEFANGDFNASLVLNEEATIEEIQNLMQHIYAGLMIYDKYEVYEVEIFDQERISDRLMYTVWIDAETGELSFQEENGYAPIEEILMEE